MIKSFLAPDISIVEEPKYNGSLTIRPNEIINIQFSITLESIGLDKAKDIDVLELKFHTRSYLAQAGLFFEPNREQLTPADLEKLRKGIPMNLNGAIQNFSPCLRILQTKGGAAIGRFLNINETDRVAGQELEQIASLGQAQYLTADKKAIALELSPEEEILITEHKEVVVLDGSRVNWVNHTRKLPCAKHKEEPTHAFSLCVTTGVVTIPAGCFGWIHEQTSEPGVIHLKSQLLEPGTDWRVRVELYASESIRRIPKAVYLSLYRVTDCIPRKDGNTFKMY